MKRPETISYADFIELSKMYKGKRLVKIINKVDSGFPVQYAIGNVIFLKSKLFVNKNVLIPRPETELLTEKLINYIKKYNTKNTKILDLCTGSGAIAISLKMFLPDSYVEASDISFKALKVARKNSKYNKVNIVFKRYNVLNKIRTKNKFSVLVSNPPYVGIDENVDEKIKYEPQKAIYPKGEDIIFYKKILDKSKDILYKQNIIAFEIGMNQADKICSYAKKIYPSSKISVEKDYTGRNRFIFIFNNFE